MIFVLKKIIYLQIIITPLANACSILDNEHAFPKGLIFIYFMKRYQDTPIRIAVMIDGGYFIKRYKALYNKNNDKTPEIIANDMYKLAHCHVGNNNYLYRIFYYDCLPFEKKIHNPISKRCINFAKTEEAACRNTIIDQMKKKRKVALRLGTLKESKQWIFHRNIIDKLLKKDISIDDLQEKDIYYELRQKGIDMKIGVDIASLSLKHLVDKIVLIAGDSDFVPAAKLARREGIDFVLDAMHTTHIESSLYEHIDGLENISLYKNTNPKKKERKKENN